MTTDAAAPSIPTPAELDELILDAIHRLGDGCTFRGIVNSIEDGYIYECHEFLRLANDYTPDARIRARLERFNRTQERAYKLLEARRLVSFHLSADERRERDDLRRLRALGTDY